MDEKVTAVFCAVDEGDTKNISRIVKEALGAGYSAEEIMNSAMMPAMEAVGEKFHRNEYFVSDMLLSAKTMKKGIAVLKPYLGGNADDTPGNVIIGTVSGDLHDIGKDIVAAMLRASGFNVLDLGVDVSGAEFVEAAEKNRDVDIVAVSALLTATLPAMKKIVSELNAVKEKRKFKIMVGGAPVTEKFAASIKADAYSEDAPEAVKAARRLMQELKEERRAGAD